MASKEVAKEGPKDAQVMTAILKDMGVSEYEPRLVNQMLEFTYRYVTDVLDDAKVYSSHAGKKNIDVEDAKLAVQCKLDHSFTTPPPKDFLMDIAKHKNSTALPLIKPYTGPKLPPERYCITQPNYRLKSVKKQKVTTQPIMSTIAPTPRFALQTGLGTTTLKPAVPGQQLNLRPTQPTTIIRSAQPNPPVPLIRVNPGSVANTQQMTISALDVSSLKRKREDDM